MNAYPRLHNAMWPGLVGKGSPGAEPAIDLDTMLDLTAKASVNGVKFDGVDLFLFDPHVSIDATGAELKRLADKIAAKGRRRSGQQGGEILQEPARHRPPRRVRQRIGDRAGLRFGERVVEPVHQQDGAVLAGPRERARELLEAVRGGVRVDRQPRGREVAFRQVVRHHRAAVGCRPEIRRRQRVHLVVGAAPVDEGAETEAGEQLWKLRGMAERRPTSERELLDVPGVGPVKLERYGAAFLAALREG